jgi:protease I
MDKKLAGKKILVLVANGVEEAVMSSVQREMLKAGAVPKTVAVEVGLVNSWNVNENNWGLFFPVDQQISKTLGVDFDALIVPSGLKSVDKLGASGHSERIISSFVETRKPMVFMGNAEALLDKTGHATQKNSPLVMTGECFELESFIESMMDHLSAVPLAKVAA